jgi:hypothetical protein
MERMFCNHFCYAFQDTGAALAASVTTVSKASDGTPFEGITR